jgi:thiamine-phosphate pyrophosphorylase
MKMDYTLYLVTDDADNYPHGLLAGVEAALLGGVTLVQFRAVLGSRQKLYQTAIELRSFLRSRQVPLVVNNHVDLALAVDAEGVHVGQNDLPPAIVRRLIGPERVLGLSITNADQLKAVDFSVVDYLGVGPVFATESKLDAAPPIGLSVLSDIVRQSVRPVVAIGGISVTNAPAVFSTGIAGIAVVSGLASAANPQEAARGFRAAAARVSP